MQAEAHPGVDFTWDRALEVLGLGWGRVKAKGNSKASNIIKTPLAERTQEQQDRLLDYFLAHVPVMYQEKLKVLKAAELIARSLSRC